MGIILIKMLKSLALLATSVMAATQEECDLYPIICEAMEGYGADWEPTVVHTENGYNNLLIHITNTDNRTSETPDLNPVIFQHGMGANCEEYLFALKKKRPMAFQMADRGHDVYLTNN